MFSGGDVGRRQQFPLAGLEEELGATRHEADELRRRLNDVQDQRKAFSIVALSIFRVVRAEELLLIDRLQALPGRIRAAMSLGACHGAMTALASVQLRSSLHLGVLGGVGFASWSTW